MSSRGLTGLGNFIIAGSSPAGTGQLYALLQQHEKVFLPKKMAPECHFFARKDRYQKGLEYYRSHYFADALDHQVWGERSSLLISSHEAPGRIQRSLPKTKLIFLLRNPLGRAFAHYRFTALAGYEDLSFLEALERENERMESENEFWKEIKRYAYIQRSRYHQELTRYMKIFDESRILILRSEELKVNLKSTMDEVFQFLEVAPLEELREVSIFRSPDVKDVTKQFDLKRKYGSELDQAIQTLREGGDPQTPCERALKQNMTWEKPSMNQAEQEFLLHRLLPEIQALEHQLGWDLSAWKMIGSE